MPTQSVITSQLERLLAPLVADAKQALSPAPKRVVTIAPGDSVAWDECCDGFLWSRLQGVAPIVPQGAVSGGSAGCGVIGYIATVELGILRCAAVLNDRGIAPSANQINEDGLEAVRDMETLANVLTCNDDVVRSLVSWTPLGPEGGCHGGAWLFTVRLSNCADCG